MLGKADTVVIELEGWAVDFVAAAVTGLPAIACKTLEVLLPTVYDEYFHEINHSTSCGIGEENVLSTAVNGSVQITGKCRPQR